MINKREKGENFNWVLFLCETENLNCIESKMEKSIILFINLYIKM